MAPERRLWLRYDHGMRPRWGSGLAGIVLAFAILGGAVPSAISATTTATVSCGPQGGETLAVSSDLRVYRAEPEYPEDVYACGPALLRPVRVGPVRGSRHDGRGIWFGVLHKPVIDGYWVGAGEDHTEGTDFGSTWVRTINVRTHRLAACRLGGWANLWGMRFGRVLVAPRGTLVWLADDAGEPELGLCTRNSRLVLLDEGAGIDGESVELDGSMLTWTDSGTGKHLVLVE